MTGRGAGYCAGYGTPGFMNPVPGRGRGRGFGRGWGRGWGRGRGFWAMGQPGYAPMYGAPYPGSVGPLYGAPYPGPEAYGYDPSPQQEAEALKAQAQQFEATLAGIRKRLDELEAEQEKQKS